MKSSYRPDEAAALLRPWDGQWWIAGGWALDLFLSGSTRPHQDLDVAILRRDQRAIRDHLGGWTIHPGYGRGVIDPAPWIDGSPDPSIPALWCRPGREESWSFELLLSEAIGDRWQFPEDRSIQLPLPDIGLVTASGIPYLKPEIILLFRVKRDSDHDRADLDRVLPKMSPASKRWLQSSLGRVHPRHEWLDVVAH